MRYIAGTSNESPNRGPDRLTGHGERELALEYIKQFRFVSMNMERRPPTGRHLLFKDGVSPIRFHRRDLERRPPPDNTNAPAFARIPDDWRYQLGLRQKNAWIGHD